MQLRAELDALFMHLYGLTEGEILHVLDAFHVLKRNEQLRWGEFRTARLVIDAFEATAGIG